MNSQEKIQLTLVIPVYNEEKIIEKTLTQVLLYLENKKYEWEVVVVDDGSQDRTVSIVKSFNNKHIRFFRLKFNEGKGAAIRAGVRTAKGKFILFSDADLSVPIHFTNLFLAKLEKEGDVAIGSRRVEGSRIIKHQNTIRESLGKVFTFLSKIITFTNMSDFTCGFKAFKKEAAVAIFSRTLLNRWAYDSEIIFLAKKFRYKIVEVPVDWRNRKDSRVLIGSAILTSLIDLLKIRLNDFLGKYD